MKVKLNELEQKQYEHLRGIVEKLNLAFADKFRFSLYFNKPTTTATPIYTLTEYVLNANYKGVFIPSIKVKAHNGTYEKLLKGIEKNVNAYLNYCNEAIKNERTRGKTI